jgi:DNA-directed RNA polymerase subunit RPC12/RpoP
MNGGYVEDYESIYGCFRCGAILADVEEGDDAFAKCSECGEHSVINFIHALDLINDLHLKGLVKIKQEETLEDFSDYIDEE